jgi:hypothetical protein
MLPRHEHRAAWSFRQLLTVLGEVLPVPGHVLISIPATEKRLKMLNFLKSEILYLFGTQRTLV